MPEPETVAGTEDKPQVEPPVVETPPQTPPETPPAPTVPEEDREPSGDSPEAIFARKQYRAAKEARQVAAEREREAKEEREARIRLEEQLRLAKEAPTTKETKIYSIVEVRQAVRDGRITEDQGDEYIQNTIIPHQISQTLEAERKKETEKQPQERALADVEAYKEKVPELTDTRSDTFKKVATEYQRLIREDGLPNNYVTQKLAIRAVLGSLSDIERRESVDRNTRAGLKPAPVDAGAGGSASAGTTSAATKVPKEFVDYWRSIPGVTEKQVEKYAQAHLEKQARRRSMVG